MSWEDDIVAANADAPWKDDDRAPSKFAKTMAAQRGFGQGGDVRGAISSVMDVGGEIKRQASSAWEALKSDYAGSSPTEQDVRSGKGLGFGEHIKQTLAAGRIPLDAFRLLSSPVSGATRAFVTHPLSALTGLPEEAFDQAMMAVKAPIGRISTTVPLTMTQQAASEARGAGYAIPRTYAGDETGTVTKVLSGIAGKGKMEQVASAGNQAVTNRLAAKSLGLPEDTALSGDALRGVRQRYGQAQDAIATAIPAIKADKTFHDEIAALGSDPALRAAVPNLQENEKIKGLRDSILSYKAAPTPDTAMKLVRHLKDGAAINFKTGDTELAFAQRDAANSIEDLIERNLQRAGKSDLMKDFKDARLYTSRSYDIETATNPATGNVNAGRIATLSRKRKMTGDLSTIAKTANAFPRVVGDPSRMGGVENFSPLDIIGAAVTAPHEPIASAMLIARPVIRRMLLRPPANAGMNMLKSFALTAPNTARIMGPAIVGNALADQANQ